MLPPPSILDEIKSDQGMDKARLFEKAKTLQNKSGEFGVQLLAADAPKAKAEEGNP
mgnify:CR=1 FL=1